MQRSFPVGETSVSVVFLTREGPHLYVNQIMFGNQRLTGKRMCILPTSTMRCKKLQQVGRTVKKNIIKKYTYISSV